MINQSTHENPIRGFRICSLEKDGYICTQCVKQHRFLLAVRICSFIIEMCSALRALTCARADARGQKSTKEFDSALNKLNLQALYIHGAN
jgi:hypothetical protein